VPDLYRVRLLEQRFLRSGDLEALREVRAYLARASRGQA
jgi:hypothetical protein